MKNENPCYDTESINPNQCFACKDKLKKSVQCEFCAMKFCNDCRLRSRPFPKSITFENGEKIYGKICKICDRKFLMLDQYKRQVSIYTIMLANMSYINIDTTKGKQR